MSAGQLCMHGISHCVSWQDIKYGRDLLHTQRLEKTAMGPLCTWGPTSHYLRHHEVQARLPPPHHHHHV